MRSGSSPPVNCDTYPIMPSSHHDPVSLRNVTCGSPRPWNPRPFKICTFTMSCSGGGVRLSGSGGATSRGTAGQTSDAHTPAFEQTHHELANDHLCASDIDRASTLPCWVQPCQWCIAEASYRGGEWYNKGKHLFYPVFYAYHLLQASIMAINMTMTSCFSHHRHDSRPRTWQHHVHQHLCRHRSDILMWSALGGSCRHQHRQQNHRQDQLPFPHISYMLPSQHHLVIIVADTTAFVGVITF